MSVACHFGLDLPALSRSTIQFNDNRIVRRHQIQHTYLATLPPPLTVSTIPFDWIWVRKVS